MAASKDLEAALLEAYKRTAREPGHWGGYFLRPLKTYGGVKTAKRLLAPRGGDAS
jgi:hypothetical protein